MVGSYTTARAPELDTCPSRRARLEAGRVQRMRHARARLEIVVVSREAVRIEIGVVVRVEVVEVVAVPAGGGKRVIVVVVRMLYAGRLD